MKNSNNFDELQNLWQTQRAGQFESETSQDIVSLITEKHKSFEKKQLRINLAKTFALILILVPFCSYLILYKSPSVFTYLGAGWILLSTVAFMVLYWKKQFRYSSLDLNQSGSEFIKTILNKLNYQKKLFRIHFPLLVFSLLIGINIIYLGMFSHYDITTRLVYHFAGSVFILIVSPLGLKIRKMRFNKEYQPLIDELTAINEDLKGQ